MNRIVLSTIIIGLFLSSCGSEEETPAPPSNIVQTPEPEPVVETPSVTQYTLTVTAGEGGTVSTQGGTYDEGTQLSITASPSQGYIFLAWSNGATSQTITVTMEENINLTPEFYLTNVELLTTSVVYFSELSDLSNFEVNAVLGDASASTHYFNQNGKEVILIGPVDNTDQIGERPIKQFINQTMDGFSLKNI